MSERKRDVFTLTEPVQLRFKVEGVAKLPSIEQKASSGAISNIIAFCTRKKNASFDSTTKTLEDNAVKLQFIEKLSNECLVVGNDRRLDVLDLTFQDEGNIDVRLLGRITTNFEIRQVQVERKKCAIYVAGSRVVQIHIVDLKNSKLWQQSSLQTELDIAQIMPYNDTTMFVFFDSYAQIYSTENHKISERERINYKKQRGMESLKVLEVPRSSEKYLNIFFYDPEHLSEEGSLFSLYKMQIYQEGLEFRDTSISDVHKISTHHLKTVRLHNYDRQTFIVNLPAQVSVIKKHYPIDHGQLSHRTENSRLLFLENKNLLHVCDDRVEAHSLEVLANSINIRSFDCIQLAKPQGAKLQTALAMNEDAFVLVYVPSKQRNPRETKYWIIGTQRTSIKSKMKDLMNTTTDQTVIFEVAEKMGMTRCEIFLELWQQSKKNRKEDFDILIETEDYRTIISQVKSALRKECISFKQIERIEKACLKLLEKQMSKSPTESLIRNYIKSHFLLRKYEVELLIKSRAMKIRASKLNATEEDLQDKRLVIGIQEFQDIRKRHIVKYIVEQMKKKDPESLSIMKSYIEGFKMVLRAIYKEFLREIIKELSSEELLFVIKVYGEILPKKDEIKQEYNQKSGVWANITSLQWSKTLQYEKIQTIDNAEILNAMTSKDWFRWDWLVKHDFMNLKRQEFERKFQQNRQQKIYYVFFDLLFNILKPQDPNLQLIVQKVEEDYEIPAHLVGRIFLYWELHKFFSEPEVLPGYEMRFEEFMPLKEDEIYQLVFSNENRNCKRLILTSIKDIYTRITRKEMYDDSILTYFKAPYSSIADLKYLLNRINNQKMEFHEANQNLYRVLVEAVFYKLRWQESQPPPIRDILVYFESIPMSNEELDRLQDIQKIDQQVDSLRKLKLKCNLKEFFQSGKEVLRSLAEHLLETTPGKALKLRVYAGDEDISFTDIIDKLLGVRDCLFKDTISNHTVLETLVSLAMNYDELVPDVERMIKEESLLQQFDIVDPLGFMEIIVQEKVMKAYESKPVFTQNKPFVTSLLHVLPEDSPKRKQLQAHLDLGLLLTTLENPPKAPLTISSRFIEKQLAKQKISTVNKLDINLIFELMSAMGYTEGISSLYEVMILKYLEEGEWDQAINYILLWNEQSDHKSVVFSALLINKIGEELSKDLKNNLVEVCIIKYYQPNELLDFAREIISCEQINRRKELITSFVLENEAPLNDFFQKNPLLRSEFKQFAESKMALERVKQFYEDIRKGDVELQRKEIYYLYYRLLLCDPIRAHELYSKYFEQMDISRVEGIFLEIVRRDSTIFNQSECILFFYKSLLAVFTSCYLGKQFGDLGNFFGLPFEGVEASYPNVLEQLPHEMSNVGEKDRYLIMRSFRRMYLRQREPTGRDDYSVEAQEEDDETEKMSEFKRIAEKSKPYSKIQTKKTINPMQIIEPATPMMTEEDQDYVESANLWRTGVVNLRPQGGVTSSVRYKAKVRDLSGEKDAGESPDETSRKSLEFKHSESQDAGQEPHSSTMKKLKRDPNDAKESKSEHNNNFDVNQGSVSEISSQISNAVEKELKKPIYRTFAQSSALRTRSRRGESRQESPSKDAGSKAEEVPTTVYYQKRESLTNSRNLQEKVQSDNSPQKWAKSQSIIEAPHHVESEGAEKTVEPVLTTVQKIMAEPTQEPKPEIKATIAQSKISDSPNVRNSRTKEEEVQEAAPVDLQASASKPGSRPISRTASRPTSRPVSRPASRPASRQKGIDQPKQEVVEQAKAIAVDASITRSQIKRHMDEVTPTETINLESSTVTKHQEIEEKAISDQQPLEEDVIDERTRIVVDAIIRDKDFSQLQQQIPKHLSEQLVYLQRIVRIVFKEAPFKTFLETVEKLKTINIKFQSAVRAQNVRVMRNAFKAQNNFDLKLIFTPEVLYISCGPNIDIESNNKLIFDSLKPRIKALVNDTNLFVISKLMSLSFNFNKAFEFRVQYYYLEGLMRSYIESSNQLKEEEIKMYLEKIEALLSRLPINTTAQRFGKMMDPLKGTNPVSLLRLLNTFLAILERKKETAEGAKFQAEIEQCSSEVTKLIEETSAR